MRVSESVKEEKEKLIEETMVEKEKKIEKK